MKQRLRPRLFAGKCGAVENIIQGKIFFRKIKYFTMFDYNVAKYFQMFIYKVAKYFPTIYIVLGFGSKSIKLL